MWFPPTQWSWKETVSDVREHQGAAFFVNTLTGESTWERPAVLAWSRKSRTKTFYFNRITGTAFWFSRDALLFACLRRSFSCADYVIRMCAD